MVVDALGNISPCPRPPDPPDPVPLYLSDFMDSARGISFKGEKYILLSDLFNLVGLLKALKCTNPLNVISQVLHFFE